MAVDRSNEVHGHELLESLLSHRDKSVIRDQDGRGRRCNPLADAADVHQLGHREAELPRKSSYRKLIIDDDPVRQNLKNASKVGDDDQALCKEQTPFNVPSDINVKSPRQPYDIVSLFPNNRVNSESTNRLLFTKFKLQGGAACLPFPNSQQPTGKNARHNAVHGSALVDSLTTRGGNMVLTDDLEDDVQIKTEQEDNEFDRRPMVTSSGRNRGGKTVEPKYVCQVCGDLAAGFHCGAYVCEACKVHVV